MAVRSQYLRWPSIGTFHLTLQFFKHLRQRASDSHPLAQCSTRPPPLIQHSSDVSLHISSDIKALQTTYFHYRTNTSISKLFLTLLSLLCPPPPPSCTLENFMEYFKNKVAIMWNADTPDTVSHSAANCVWGQFLNNSCVRPVEQQ